MNRILTDLSTPAIVHAVKANLYEFFRYLGRSKQTEFVNGSGLMRWNTRVPHP
ncbi:MAG: hypothetical protein HY872_09750 [Chloroflexi bacterium]|nr:hypothetical protein [Chloroflexota bacterium]